MKKHYIILSLVLTCLMACEDIYNPDIEKMEELLVIEARIVHGQGNNSVRIYKTISFDTFKNQYPPVRGANVSLTDNQGNVIPMFESDAGTYMLRQSLDSSRLYKILILSEGETYSSPYQSVPKVPSIDTVYVAPAEQFVNGSTDEASGNLQKVAGAQVYIDIAEKNGLSHFRFKGRKICQYAYNRIPATGPPIETPVYAWLSLVPVELFNIAAPPEYSVSDDVKKHPLVFLERSHTVLIPDTPTFFSGWIYICQQYAISEGTYNFYKDLNRQLSAGGKIFDPLYTQARGNITCISNSEKVVLGNFEIATVREHRFYVEWTNKENYFIKRIPYYWEIPQEGSVQEMPPVWWEVKNKEYPAIKSGMIKNLSLNTK